MIAAHQIGCQRADADDADDPARAMREPRPEARDLEVEFHRPDEEGGLPLSDPVNAERADAEAEVEMQEGAAAKKDRERRPETRSEEHTSELQSLMRNSYAVFCLNKKT